MTAAELRAALANGHSLAGADLTEANPFVHDWSGCDLTGADLSSRHVPSSVSGRAWPRSWHDNQQATLRKVRMAKARLDSTDLSRVVAIRGDFRAASLRKARLVEADLSEADFRGADLWGADLAGAILFDARFDGAVWDHTTIWPEGFAP